MEPGSRTDASPEPFISGAADIAGTFIALLTLIVPVAAIAYFSTPTPSSIPAGRIQTPAVIESSVWNRHHPLRP
ncbi:MAG: hypothetical protein Fur0046_34520 [Cyanobacteria bacterium J069]|nr:MAG: hypothetical protein D6742_20490 [Cyanobacteria bacterium J069]